MPLSDEVERIRIAFGALVVRLGTGEGHLAPALPGEPVWQAPSARLISTLTPPLSHMVIEERGRGNSPS
jgi:hypothetical protein